MGDNGTEDVVVGRTYRSPRPPWWIGLFVLAYSAWGFVVHRPFFVVLAGLYTLAYGAGRTRRPTRIDAAGVTPSRWPWSRQQVIRWDDVAQVIRPDIARQTTAILLVDGRERTLIDIPSAHAAAVARIGGKELRPAPRPVLPPPPPRRPTEAETEREFERRAERLAADRARLQAELDRRAR